MTEVFFTSDTHFGHENIIRLCQRPFASAEEMDEAMIARWNAKVGPNDTIWHLGDFARATPDRMRHILGRLNGRKSIITGNHDGGTVKSQQAWASVSEYREIVVNNDTQIVLFHYPMVEWNGFHRNAIHLHGHQHNKKALQAKHRMDVGVDANNFQPWALDEIIKEMRK